MTTPKHARDVRGRGRYYMACCETCPLGDRELISVTNAQGVVNKPALVPAAVKITAEKAWSVLPRMVALSRKPATDCANRRVVARCGQCRFCLTAEIKAEHHNQWERAADLGTEIHRHAHAHALGQKLPYDETVNPYIGQYHAWLDAWRVDMDKHVEAAEITVYSLTRGQQYAGTADLWVKLPIDPRTGQPTRNGKRHLFLVDIKTSAKKDPSVVYADQILQLAGLRYAPIGLLPDDTQIPTPQFAGAAILNLRTDAHALIPLPADREAHKGFLHAVGLQRFMHGIDVKTWVPFDAPTIPDPTTKVA